MSSRANNSKYAQRLGEEITNQDGQLVRIVTYRNMHDIDVLFPDTGEIRRTNYTTFSKGMLRSYNRIANLPGEEWRDVVGFEGYYIVSNKGRVASIRKGEPRILKQQKTAFGYYRIAIHIRPFAKHYMVHRWVAEAFIPNENNLPFINHKDECGLNNCVENLEWCDRLYNNTYGTALERAHETRVKHGVTRIVYQYDFKGNLLNTFNSIYKAAHSLGISYGSISDYIHKRHHSSGGYIFVLNKEEIAERLSDPFFTRQLI